MLISLLLISAGLVVLIGGGYLVVEGASSLARSLGMSQLAVGLTVVAFGTSAPELAVNLTAALEGGGDIAFGNVIGSNIANIGLVLGLTALVRGLEIRSQVLTREIPVMLMATAAAVLMALDPQLRGEAAVFDLEDGLLLLLFFSVFMYGSVRAVLFRRKEDPFLAASSHVAPEHARRRGMLSGGMVVLGLGLLVGGGELAVRGAGQLAAAAGVPIAVIGATVVAVGTSLPELVTSLVAAARRQADIAVGNVVGSNIFNLLFIMGATAVARPVPVPPSGSIDLVALAGFSALLLVFSHTHGRCVARWEGSVLLLLWIAYVVGRFCCPGA